MTDQKLPPRRKKNGKKKHYQNFGLQGEKKYTCHIDGRDAVVTQLEVQYQMDIVCNCQIPSIPTITYSDNFETPSSPSTFSLIEIGTLHASQQPTE